MTPAARTEAAIALLDEILSHPHQPADRIVAGWFRARRYAGAKDRSYISNAVFSVLRRRAELEWALGGTDIGAATPRELILAALVRDECLGDIDLAARFGGGPHAPAPLSRAEQDSAARLRSPSAAAPDWVRGNYPPCLDDSFREVLGDDIVPELQALAGRAPVDLRVNTLRGDRVAAVAALATQGISVQPTPFSPVGLRLDVRANIAGSDAFRDGLVEVQDEGSQLVALLVGAQPGETVIDWCAGGGGKTLALAAAMENRGHLLALDSSPERLEAGRHRFERAGASIIETRQVGSAAMLEQADRVLVDVPCTGSGAWRRNPAAKWRTTPEGIAEFANRQTEILSAASTAVRPGGRLVYATCSLFRAENHVQVDTFLATRRDFRLGSVADSWRQSVGGEPPSEMPLQMLTPLEHNTDGFFIAVMERKTG